MNFFPTFHWVVIQLWKQALLILWKIKSIKWNLFPIFHENMRVFSDDNWRPCSTKKLSAFLKYCSINLLSLIIITKLSYLMRQINAAFFGGRIDTTTFSDSNISNGLIANSFSPWPYKPLPKVVVITPKMEIDVGIIGVPKHIVERPI